MKIFVLSCRVSLLPFLCQDLLLVPVKAQLHGRRITAKSTTARVVFSIRAFATFQRSIICPRRPSIRHHSRNSNGISHWMLREMPLPKAEFELQECYGISRSVEEAARQANALPSCTNVDEYSSSIGFRN